MRFLAIFILMVVPLHFTSCAYTQGVYRERHETMKELPSMTIKAFNPKTFFNDDVGYVNALVLYPLAMPFMIVVDVFALATYPIAPITDAVMYLVPTH